MSTIYYVTGEFKRHNMCSKYPSFSCIQAYSRMHHCLMAVTN